MCYFEVNLKIDMYEFFFYYRLGVGNYYGIFSGVIIVFSFVVKGKKVIDSFGKNFLINLLKKGIGFGYFYVIIGVSLKYILDVYDRVRDLRNVGIV